jgi:hypothetical protein
VIATRSGNSRPSATSGQLGVVRLDGGRIKGGSCSKTTEDPEDDARDGEVQMKIMIGVPQSGGRKLFSAKCFKNFGVGKNGRLLT